MQRIRALLRRLFFLPPGVSLAVAVCGFGFVGYTLSHEVAPEIALMSYHLSAYALVVAITALTQVVPAAWQRIKASEWAARLKRSPLGLFMRLDPALRAWLSLCLSMTWNVLCAILKLTAGIVLRSLWLRSLGIYYLLLAGLRLLLARPGPFAHETPEARDWRRYRACGAVLLVMNLALLVIVILLLGQKGRFNYPGPLIYLMAIYAFYALTSATVKLARARKRGDPLLSAAKAISLTAAMVSMLALETALIERHGEDPDFHRLMVGITGGVVCQIELIIALYMMRRGTRMISGTEA